MATPHKKNDNEKVDDAIKDTFPASDPTTHGRATANEEPGRPQDRKAPIIRKEDIEAAQRGDGHKQ